MHRPRFFPVALVTFSAILFSTGQTPAPQAGEPGVEGERLPPERLELKVLKAFTAQDGAAIFRAYLVSWKGQEVVASDSLARSNYREGDTISVLAMNHPFPKGAQPHRLLAFTVMTPPR